MPGIVLDTGDIAVGGDENPCPYVVCGRVVSNRKRHEQER